MKSNCCQAIMRTVGTLTKHYRCVECGKACDEMPTKDQLWFNGIPYSECVLNFGDWDITYKDNNSGSTTIMRLSIDKKIYLKDVERKDKTIIKVMRMR
jgi:hypothetical protein